MPTINASFRVDLYKTSSPAILAFPPSAGLLMPQ
jgi:hypothetical protein